MSEPAPQAEHRAALAPSGPQLDTLPLAELPRPLRPIPSALAAAQAHVRTLMTTTETAGHPTGRPSTLIVLLLASTLG
ncbi:hypothetical protein ACWEQJ_14265 [Streptomyces cyaneofuscatus]